MDHKCYIIVFSKSIKASSWVGVWRAHDSRFHLSFPRETLSSKITKSCHKPNTTQDTLIKLSITDTKERAVAVLGSPKQITSYNRIQWRWKTFSNSVILTWIADQTGQSRILTTTRMRTSIIHTASYRTEFYRHGLISIFLKVIKCTQTDQTANDGIGLIQVLR